MIEKQIFGSAVRPYGEEFSLAKLSLLCYDSSASAGYNVNPARMEAIYSAAHYDVLLLANVNPARMEAIYSLLLAGGREERNVNPVQMEAIYSKSHFVSVHVSNVNPMQIGIIYSLESECKN